MAVQYIMFLLKVKHIMINGLKWLLDPMTIK